jgi:hypothetical protein
MRTRIQNQLNVTLLKIDELGVVVVVLRWVVMRWVVVWRGLRGFGEVAVERRGLVRSVFALFKEWTVSSRTQKRVVEEEKNRVD